MGLGFEYKQMFLYFTVYLSCSDTLSQIVVRQSEYSIPLSYLTNLELRLLSLCHVS